MQSVVQKMNEHGPRDLLIPRTLPAYALLGNQRCQMKKKKLCRAYAKQNDLKP